MEIIVPELGESIVEATVARWLKQEGETVRVGEPVVELETDKVDLEVGAKADGVIAQIMHQEGEDVQVGAVLGIIETTGSAASQPTTEPEQKESHPSEAQPREEKGTPPDQDGSAGQPALQASGEGEREQQGTPAASATPVARRMAEAQGVNLAQIQPSGDRITKEDVQRYLEQGAAPLEQAAPEEQVAPKEEARQKATGSAKAAQPEQASSQPTPSDGRREERVRMSRRRRTIAARLVEAQQTAAMLTTFNDVDMSAVMDLRKRRQEAFVERHWVKLGFMSFFVKASIGALKEFPYINAEIQGDEIVVKHYYDIGIAVGAEEGLVVPVLRNADRLSFAEIEKTIRGFITKVQEGTLSLEDLRGGTFSITNGGVYGSLLSTPILNPPQVGILGLHRIEERPVAVAGQVAIRPVMYMALSYDHRIVDGSEAVRFLVRVKELIEDPESLLLEG